MIIESCTPRSDWQKKCEDVGFNFHSVDGVYWDESHCYRFTSKQIDYLDDITQSLHDMTIIATEAIIKAGDYQRYSIPDAFAPSIEQSWRRQDKSLYGRMDIAWNGHGDAKLLEYNADTPTSVLEASVVQWDWLSDCYPDADQFNSIHEKLVEQWRVIAHPGERLHFSAQKGLLEDINTTEYLLRSAIEAGIAAEFLFIDDIGLHAQRKCFVDGQENVLRKLFKLYPLEWLLSEDFASDLVASEMQLIEPAWKVISSSKAILVKLWGLFPDHPALLPAYFSAEAIKGNYVRKPVFSREGANILTSIDGVSSETEGVYVGPFIYQAYHELPCFNNRYAVIGSWVVGGKSAGIGIREDATPITRNTSCFVPHYFKD